MRVLESAGLGPEEEPLLSLIDVAILLPRCTLENEPDLLRSTIKAWLIARFSAIYRVSTVGIYRSRSSDKECRNEGELLSLLLSYMRAPPYLKKKLFSVKKELKYVGLAPPLQIPTHTVSEKPVVGEVREALVVKVSRGRALLHIGLDAPVWVEASVREVRPGSTLFIRVKGTEPLEVEILRSAPNDVYVGYSVININDVVAHLRESGRRGVYRLGTSRLGDPLDKSLERMKRKIANSRGVLLLFGEPRRGIFDVLRELGAEPSDVLDDVVNLIPAQGTKTVRTEEALAAALQTVRLLEALSTSSAS
ncbi:MAG: putative RNA uridine N3 methyltransferase [Fervidicoccaceae archaeon]